MKTSGMTSALMFFGVVPAGIVIPFFAFGAFRETYKYIPVSDVLVLVNFGAVFGLVLLLTVRAGSSRRKQQVLAAAAVLSGIGLALYGFALWKLSGSGLLIFPPVSFLAYAIVGNSAKATRSGKISRILPLSLLATAAFLVPSALITQSLFSGQIFLPEIQRRVVIASFLSLLFSCTMLGLGVSVLKKPEAAQDRVPVNLHRNL